MNKQRQKKVYKILLSVIISGVMVACSQSKPQTTSTANITKTPTPTITLTSSPTATSTPTPTPTPIFPLSWGTPVPEFEQDINRSNINFLTRVAHFVSREEDGADPDKDAPWETDIRLNFWGEEGVIAFYMGRGWVNCKLVDFESMECVPRSGAITARNDGELFGLYGIDNNFYNYSLTDKVINIWKGQDVWRGLDGRGEVIYSRDYIDTTVSQIRPYALDPFHNILYYELWLAGDSRMITTYVLDYETDEILYKYERKSDDLWGTGILDAGFSKTGNLHAYCISEKWNYLAWGNFYIYDAEKNQMLFQKETKFCPTGQISFSNDETLLVAGNRKDRKAWVDPTQLLVVKLGEEVEATVLDYDCHIASLDFTRDDSLLAIACDDKTIRFVDPTSFEEVHRIYMKQEISGIAFSPDGSKLVSVSDSEIDIWAVYKRADGTFKNTILPMADGAVISYGKVIDNVFIGYGGRNDGYQAFVSFNLTSIPDNADILDVTVDFSESLIGGEPFENLGCFQAYSGSFFPLDAQDYYLDEPSDAILELCDKSQIDKKESISDLATAIEDALADDVYEMRLQFNEATLYNNTESSGIYLRNLAFVITYKLP